MREIGNPRIGWHVMNLYTKSPRITKKYRMGSRKMAIFQSHICKIADKKTAYNEGRLYFLAPECILKTLLYCGILALFT